MINPFIWVVFSISTLCARLWSEESHTDSVIQQNLERSEQLLIASGRSWRRAPAILVLPIYAAK